jgi:hypothetical protein
MITFFRKDIRIKILVLVFSLGLVFPLMSALALDDSDGMLAPVDGGGTSGDGSGMLAPVSTGGGGGTSGGSSGGRPLHQIGDSAIFMPNLTAEEVSNANLDRSWLKSDSGGGVSSGGGGATADGGGVRSAGESSQLKNPLKSKSIEEFILKIIDVLLVFALPIIILYIMYAGYLFVTAQGDSGQISTARSALLWAVVGGVIVLGAKVIVAVIQGTIKGF